MAIFLGGHVLVAEAGTSASTKAGGHKVTPVTEIEAAEPPKPNDPFEPVNRLTFGFNQVVDTVLINPFVTVWNTVLPEPVRTGVANVFANLDDVFGGVNHALQGNGRVAMTDFARVAVNSTVGLAGLIDVGSSMGLKKNPSDFGQTFGVWGISPGPYLVLPLIGPSTLRETAGRGVRLVTDPRSYLALTPSYAMFGTEYVQTRADSRANEDLIAASSFDRYAFTRSLYLQKRVAFIQDGRDLAAGLDPNH